ncbi:putative glucan 1,3-beta-glucosidase [Clavispora lusitaniae]|uniref:Glucan 1,3-beta-glucosidase n=1 Tax=Clavispora lusitaniae TaxID=36911 RepID=A0ACD0WQ47_CLALS|nr:putative glucan 1,3-beta-glucosidase [Clavispora lusitaniae]QFZ35353.1 putative glucan 1,3-beta-glucosidase [Clavispora lusitaniae]QFZ41047.1 putative glucan 1,3-beta-glucosidase [Clavispora lusitaniae]QFZ46728.1 putative glucan 1,3-beta-glucosidase [Clavispora lusitaniae]QFZ52393.1 putative glucan 1,3-beta-glucosidase [Clavispora lusitaniae]
MQFKFLCTIAAAISSAAAIGDLGFNLGVKDNEGNCKTADEYSSDFSKLEAYTKIVKTYAVSDCNTLQNLGPAAEKAGFQVMFGIWPTDSSHFEAEKEALKTYLPTISKDTVKVFTVGSEALYRNDMSASDLASAISDVKSLLADIKDKNGDSYSSVPVGTVDSWNVLVDGGSKPAIEAADFVFANAFSYWQGQTMQNASYSFFDDIMQALQTIQGIKGSTDIDFWVGETGWPSDGTNYESSYPSVDDAKQFWKEAICAIRAWGINVCVFEAFDEAWKPNTSGTSDVEKHWGVYDASNNLKYSLGCSF